MYQEITVILNQVLVVDKYNYHNINLNKVVGRDIFAITSKQIYTELFLSTFQLLTYHL